MTSGAQLLMEGEAAEDGPVEEKGVSSRARSVRTMKSGSGTMKARSGRLREITGSLRMMKRSELVDGRQLRGG